MWSLCSLKTNLKLDDLQKLFSRTVLNETEQKQIVSIFSTLAGEDNELSQEEWNNFQSEIDENSDKNITKEELYKTISTKFKNIRSLTKGQLKIFYSLVNNMINKPINTDKEEVYAEENCLPENNNRGLQANGQHKRSVTNGSFTKNWLLSDKYDSKTYEEWLRNNNYTHNKRIGKKIAETIHERIEQRDTKPGYCAKIVQDTLRKVEYDYRTGQHQDDEESNVAIIETTEKFSLIKETDRQAWALQTASVLSENPNFKELPHNIVVNMDLKKLPVGSIVVYDAGYKKDQKIHAYGHIDIVDENGKGCSDQVRSLATDKQKTHIRVFIPVLV